MIRLRQYGLDITPIRESRSFRNYWIGSTISSLGYQMAMVAVLAQVWDLTEDSFWVGTIGLATAIPTVLFTLLGGAFADTLNRRKLLIISTFASIIVAVALALQALLELKSLLLVLILLAIRSTISAMSGPARQAVLPSVLSSNQLAAGIAVRFVTFQGTMLIGPAIAGIVIAQWGIGVCFAFQAVAMVGGLIGLHSLPSLSAATTSRANLRIIGEGLALVKKNRIVSASLLVDLAVTLLAMPMAVLPALNEEHFGGDPERLGWFLSAMAAGGVTAGLLSGTYVRARHTGAIQLVSSLVWGGSYVMILAWDNLWWALGMLALGGAADIVTATSRSSIVQLTVEDQYRGRVSALELLFGIAGPEIGNFRGGVLAAWTSPVASLAMGGASAIVGIGAIAARFPELRRYRRT